MTTMRFEYESSSYVFGSGDDCSVLEVEVQIEAYDEDDYGFDVTIYDIDGNEVKESLLSKKEVSQIYQFADEIARENAYEAYIEAGVGAADFMDGYDD